MNLDNNKQLAFEIPSEDDYVRRRLELQEDR